MLHYLYMLQCVEQTQTACVCRCSLLFGAINPSVSISFPFMRSSELSPRSVASCMAWCTWFSPALFTSVLNVFNSCVIVPVQSSSVRVSFKQDSFFLSAQLSK